MQDKSLICDGLERKLSSTLIRGLGILVRTMQTGANSSLWVWKYEGKGIECTVRRNENELDISWKKKDENKWNWRWIHTEKDIDEIIEEIRGRI